VHRNVANTVVHSDLDCLSVLQVANVCRTTILRRAWYRGQRIEVHGLVYGLADGLLRRLGVSVSANQAWEERYRTSLQSLTQQP
jgi:carbonic anhydrase